MKLKNLKQNRLWYFLTLTLTTSQNVQEQPSLKGKRIIIRNFHGNLPGLVWCLTWLWASCTGKDAILFKSNFRILNNFSRSKLDPNRAIEDAAQGSPEAEAAYREFHATIRRVQVSFNFYVEWNVYNCQTQKTMATSGLLLDFHGQRHLQNSTELGYVYRWDGQSIMYPKMLLRKSDLNEGNLPREGVSSVSSLLARFETHAQCR